MKPELGDLDQRGAASLAGLATSQRVALIAIMRKLVILANALVQDGKV